MANGSALAPAGVPVLTDSAPRMAAWPVRNVLFSCGVLVILALIGSAALAPVLTSHDPAKMGLRNRLAPPSRTHVLGTDEYGRDLLSRIMYGGRASLQVGVIAVGLAALLGTLLGVTAGYKGGSVDNLLMRLVDMILAFPTILLALVIIAALGPSLTNLMIAMGIVYTPQFARIARGSTLLEKSSEYVEAARAVGAGGPRVILQHILPNILSPLLVQATISLAFAILAEASLSFLGLGIQPPTPSWGTMLSAGRTYMGLSPWVVVAPGLAITITVLAFNFVGDALRDHFDPRLKNT